MEMDTLKCSKTLESAGFTKKQAEAQVEVFMNEVLKNLATSKEVKNLDQKVDSNFEHLDRKLDFEINRLETKMNQGFKEVMLAIEKLSNSLSSEIKSLKGDLKNLNDEVQDLKKTIELKILVKLGGLIIALFTCGFAFLSMLMKLHLLQQ